MPRTHLLIGVAAVMIASAAIAHAQTSTGSTRILSENYTTPDTVTATVPANATLTIRWGSGTTFVTRTLPTGSTTFLAGNATFGDPTPGVAKELDVQGSDLAAFTVDGTQLAAPPPALVNLAVTPTHITSTTGTVVQTKATCTYSDGSSSDCTAQVKFTFVKGGVTAYDGAGAILGTQAGPAEVDVSLNSFTVRVDVLIIDLPIYFNGGVIALQ